MTFVSLGDLHMNRSDQPLTGNQVKGVYPYLLIVVCVWLAYAGSFDGSFLFDDYKNIVRNAHIKQLGTAVSSLSRPLLNITFWINYALGGLHVLGFHLVNVAIHTCCALLLFGIVRRTLAIVRRTVAPTRTTFPALAVALVWGVHPLTTAAVTYISQRAESLMGLFYFGALYCAIRAARSSSRTWVVAAVVACVLGMSSKEVMITAPVAILIYDWVFLSGNGRRILRERGGLYAGLLLAWGYLVLLMWGRKIMSDRAFYVWEDISPLSYLLTQFEVVAHYLRLAVWPTELCLDYRWPPVAALRAVLPEAILIAALAGGALWLVLRRRPAGFAGAWFFLILAPTSTVAARPDCAFDHRMYLPLAGVVSIIVIGSARVVGKFARPGFLRVFAAALVCGLAFMTHARNSDYRTEVTMWQDVVNKRPANLRARNDLAGALSEEGRTEEALVEFNRVLAAIPDDVRARLDAGHLRVGSYFRKDSYEYHYFWAHANMGLMMLKTRGDAHAAVDHYRRALGVIPYHGGVQRKLAIALRARGATQDEIANEIRRLRAPDSVE